MKFSRLLTCFSAIVGIQADFQNKGTVSADQAIAILDRNPLERLSDVAILFGGEIQDKVNILRSMYNGFLNKTSCSKQDLYLRMEDPEYYRVALREARLFGDTMYELMQLLSEVGGAEARGKLFFRYITI